MTEKKLKIKYKNIPKYEEKKIVFFSAKVLFIPKKLLHIVRNKIKEES